MIHVGYRATCSPTPLQQSQTSNSKRVLGCLVCKSASKNPCLVEHTTINSILNLHTLPYQTSAARILDIPVIVTEQVCVPCLKWGIQALKIRTYLTHLPPRTLIFFDPTFQTEKTWLKFAHFSNSLRPIHVLSPTLTPVS